MNVPNTRELRNKTREDAVESTLQRLSTHGAAELASRTLPLANANQVRGVSSVGRWRFGDVMGSKPLGGA